MQRVATELHEALGQDPDVRLQSLVLRSSWRWTHVRTAPFMARALWQIVRLAERREIDGVIFSSMVTAGLAVGLRRRLAASGVASAAIVHGKDITLPVELYQQFIPRVFRSLDAVLPVSHATAAECLERGLPPHKLHVVPNGIKLSRFGPLKSRTEMRRELMAELGNGSPLGDSGLLLCSVGRQIPRKGFAWFIDQVMPLLPPDVHYWVAGEGPEEENVRQAVVRRGLQDRVKLLGRISDDALHKLYRGSDVFMMPNVKVNGDMEGFGVVMLEAALGGRPAIGARLEGIQDVIREGRNGHLVESGDAWAFSEAVMQYYHRPDRMEAASHEALSFIIEKFGWPAVAHRYVDVLRTLVPAERPAPISVRLREALAG
jgi:phosphatidyl-myo-inositol dimannoside synthase